MSSANLNLSCPNPLCDSNELFSNYDAVCAHLSIPSTQCSQWAIQFLRVMSYGVDINTPSSIDSDGGYEFTKLPDPMLMGMPDDDDLPSLLPLCDAEDTNDTSQPETLPANLPPAVDDNVPRSSLVGLRKEYHPIRSASYTGGMNLLQQIDQNNELAAARKKHGVHYPFVSRADWQLGQWLATSPLPQAQITSFLRSEYIKQNKPSFSSAQDLRNRIELLPEVPRWSHQDITIPGYTAKDPITLYWRDGFDVIAQLFANPVFAKCMETTPYKLLDERTGLRVYGDFMSAQFAWDYHDTLPHGDTLLGIIAASDKTPLNFGVGNKEMHPVLLSLANIDAGVRMKATAHAFALAAYLPIPKFLDVTPQVHAILTARVYHICLDIVFNRLKYAEKHGALMSDPQGLLRRCHTPLAAYIGDLPEQRLLACVLGSESPFTTATTDQFGDADCSPRRSREHTLNLIAHACATTDPALVPAFAKTCQALGLNGVHQPFWANWGRADPSFFLTPDALHAFHKFFFDHPLRWIINIMGGEELDCRMAALQPCVGVRHWKHGISKLKQCTGREHRDFQKIVVAVIAGAVPDKVLCAIRALVEFIFQAQSLLLYDEHIHALGEALREFHAYKASIINSGGRRGKKGPIMHFNIPKLEGMHRVAWNASMMGAPYQYTSDITERCHITHVKTPYRRSSHRNFHEQCCRYMDRVEKMHLFSLYVSLKANNASLLNEMFEEASIVADHYPEATWLSRVLPPDDFAIPGNAPKPSLFDKVRSHITDDHSTAFLVNVKPHQANLAVNDAAHRFNISDLRGALGDFFTLQQTYAARRGQRKSNSTCMLPFSHINVWHNFRMQQLSAQSSNIVRPARTFQALPPSPHMQYGRCNTVLVHVADGSGEQLSSSDDADGYRVAQVRMIFSPVASQAASSSPPPIYLYCEFFRFSNTHRQVVDGAEIFSPAPYVDMFTLIRHFRGNGTRMGDIIPLTDVREIVELVPRFGAVMDKALTCDNSLEIPDTFYMNNFADKETFHAVLSYQ